MFTRCLFCHARFPENGRLGHTPRGRRIAYDAVRGRLWLVCERCGRWSLVPLEDRRAALVELERIVRDEAHDVGGTANITLLSAPPLMLVRVGKAGLTERSAWRYGREIERRRGSFGIEGRPWPPIRSVRCTPWRRCSAWRIPTSRSTGRTRPSWT